MKKTKTKCYLYTRVSTSMQVDGYSLDAQRDKLRKYAEYEDMVVAGEDSDEGFDYVERLEQLQEIVASGDIGKAKEWNAPGMVAVTFDRLLHRMGKK